MLHTSPRGPEFGIVRYPRLFAMLRPLDSTIARTLYPPLIILPDDLYQRIRMDGENDPDAWAVIVHERAHIKRVQATIFILGPILFGFRFLIGDKKFILQEELYAIGEEMKYRKTRNIPYNIERKAKQFSSRLYRNVLPYTDAKSILEKLWKDMH